MFMHGPPFLRPRDQSGNVRPGSRLYGQGGRANLHTPKIRKQCFDPTFFSAFPESEATYSYVLHIPKVRETITIKIIGILVSNEKKWFSKYDTIGF